MSISETVFVVSSVINVLVLILVFIMYTKFIDMKTYVSQLHTGMTTVLSKLFTVEHLMVKLSTGFTEFIQMTEGLVDRVEGGMLHPRYYRTGDGKYTAHSLNELIEKIKNDDAEKEYFSEDEINKLRKLFEEDDEDTFTDDED